MPLSKICLQRLRSTFTQQQQQHNDFRRPNSTVVFVAFERGKEISYEVTTAHFFLNHNSHFNLTTRDYGITFGLRQELQFYFLHSC